MLKNSLTGCLIARFRCSANTLLGCMIFFSIVLAAPAKAFSILEAIGVKEPKDNVEVTVKFAPEQCSDKAYPLFITVNNSSNVTVEAVHFNVIGRRAGYSQEIYYDTFRKGYVSDRILDPRQSDSRCYELPRGGFGLSNNEAKIKYGDKWQEGQMAERMSTFPPQSMEWVATIRYIEIAD